jgi:CheY-like chemotaxis protein
MPYSLPVLVVDDTDICRIGTALLLETMGFKCELALNGSDALERFKPGKYWAILMDYEMQGMSGAQCTDTIRKLEAPTGTRIPVIGLTSHRHPSIIRECLESGMDAVLPKDCPSNDLFDVLKPLIFARSNNGSG